MKTNKKNDENVFVFRAAKKGCLFVSSTSEYVLRGAIVRPSCEDVRSDFVLLPGGVNWNTKEKD